MSSFKITLSGAPELEIPGLDQGQLEEVGNVIIESMTQRMLSGNNLSDQPAKPLTKGYARYKQRRGAEPIRNMRLTGHTLADLGVVSQQDNSVTVGFHSADARQRAIFNQSIDPMFGLSPHDQEVVRTDVHEKIIENLKGTHK